MHKQKHVLRRYYGWENRLLLQTSDPKLPYPNPSLSYLNSTNLPDSNPNPNPNLL